MGTVNHKGYKKLPPAPIALNELEVEKFGLEEWEDDDEDEEEDLTGVIVDIEDEEDMKSKIDEEAVKAFEGLKVEDMVKVIAKGKFQNEDGIIRRLKDGRILVRFYTYGTMFEEWMAPGDVRKLTELEVLRGLSGPTQPITQQDFDNSGRGGYGGRERRDREPMFGGNQRNRRQDRVANRYDSRGKRSDNEHYEQQRNDSNWNWYQEQQQQQRQTGRTTTRDGSTNIRAGSDRGGSRDDWALGDVDSQWGRGGDRPQGDRRRSRVARRS